VCGHLRLLSQRITCGVRHVSAALSAVIRDQGRVSAVRESNAGQGAALGQAPLSPQWRR